ncbi:MAG TPA: hypothetical protein VF546_24945 [Pyrinomonadaceae bacterium]
MSDETRAGPAAAAHSREDAASLTGSPRLAIAATAERPRRLRARARRRLTHLLISKSLVETLFVAALAVLYVQHNFKPTFRGSLDAADARVAYGWAVDEAAPDARVEVHLYVDGHFAGRARADQTRADVRAAGRARDDRHGFTFTMPPLPPGAHEARVYALHASAADRFALQQVDKALRFDVPATPESQAVRPDWWEAASQP